MSCEMFKGNPTGSSSLDGLVMTWPDESRTKVPRSKKGVSCRD